MRTISALLLGTLFAALASATPARAQPLLPDLVADMPVAVKIENAVDADGHRLLLRFTAYVHNVGPGRLEIDGTDGANLVMGDVAQRVFDADGSSSLISQPLADLRYETTDSHKHWHLMKVASYRLVAADRKTDVAPSQKVGFCLEDADAVVEGAPQLYPNDSACKWNQPDASTVEMGISPGWRDVYGWSLAYQWIDLSSVQPGHYELRADVDPNNVVTEANEVNAPAFAVQPIGVPGYVAKPRRVRPQGTSATTIKLGAKAVRSDYRDLGSRQFKIVRGPRHGRLDVPKGRWFTAASVRYRPSGSRTRSDTFTYVARDRRSPHFPLEPTLATVTIGAPARASAAPSPPRPVAPERNPLARPSVTLPASGGDRVLRVAAARRGDVVAMSVAARRSGRMTLRLGSRSCTFAVVRGTSYSCRLPAPDGHEHLTVGAVLTSPGHGDVRRRIPVAADHLH